MIYGLNALILADRIRLMIVDMKYLQSSGKQKWNQKMVFMEFCVCFLPFVVFSD